MKKDSSTYKNCFINDKVTTWDFLYMGRVFLMNKLYFSGNWRSTGCFRRDIKSIKWT